jgi:hypothetical protein
MIISLVRQKHTLLSRMTNNPNALTTAISKSPATATYMDASQ